MGTKGTLENDNSYLIQAPWGELLHILRSETEDSNYDPKADPMTVVRHTGKIEIYKIDIEAHTVVEVDCLRDHALFLGHNQTLCLRAEEHPPLKANHAYFTDDSELWLMGYKNNRRDIGVFNLDNNNREELVSPQLWSNWPAPIWITPNLTKLKFACN
uniref:KIB1-4 beta-propeller domain-containing protein n=1 Tax=Arundo donax TaxID=35708 RepID=A0A0A9E327_ARUDO